MSELLLHLLNMRPNGRRGNGRYFLVKLSHMVVDVLHVPANGRIVRTEEVDMAAKGLLAFVSHIVINNANVVYTCSIREFLLVLSRSGRNTHLPRTGLRVNSPEWAMSTADMSSWSYWIEDAGKDAANSDGVALVWRVIEELAVGAGEDLSSMKTSPSDPSVSTKGGVGRALT